MFWLDFTFWDILVNQWFISNDTVGKNDHIVSLILVKICQKKKTTFCMNSALYAGESTVICKSPSIRFLHFFTDCTLRPSSLQIDLELFTAFLKFHNPSINNRCKWWRLTINQFPFKFCWNVYIQQVLWNSVPTVRLNGRQYVTRLR